MPQEEYSKYKKVEYDVAGGARMSPTPLVVTMDAAQIAGPQPIVNPVSVSVLFHFDFKGVFKASLSRWESAANKELVDDVIELPPDVEEDENPVGNFTFIKGAYFLLA